MAANYIDLPLNDGRVYYYRKRDIGKNFGVPGAGGLGSGISHVVYRVPKSEFISLNELRKIQQNELNAKIALESAEKAAAAIIRKGEINANIAGIVYTNEPTLKVDIDLPIHLESLAEKGFQLANEKLKTKYQRKRGQIVTLDDKNKVSIDDVIKVLREAFIETEKSKVSELFYKQAYAKIPKNSFGMIPREMHGSERRETDRLVQEHIDRKLPKIEVVLEKLREGMILGFAPHVAPHVVPKEENLIHFNNIKSINFAATSAPASAKKVIDPFEGLNFSPNVTHSNFVAADIEIEPETVSKLSKNQRSALLSKLKGMNKSKHNSAINDFLIEYLAKGGKRKTRRANKSRNTRKVRR